MLQLNLISSSSILCIQVTNSVLIQPGSEWLSLASPPRGKSKVVARLVRTPIATQRLPGGQGLRGHPESWRLCWPVTPQPLFGAKLHHKQICQQNAPVLSPCGSWAPVSPLWPQAPGNHVSQTHTLCHLAPSFAGAAVLTEHLPSASLQLPTVLPRCRPREWFPAGGKPLRPPPSPRGCTRSPLLECPALASTPQLVFRSGSIPT